MPDEEKWSKHVHVTQGGLGAWCEPCSSEIRHTALRTMIQADGAETVSKRLNFLANVADRRGNAPLREVARADQEWVKANFEEGKAP